MLPPAAVLIAFVQLLIPSTAATPEDINWHRLHQPVGRSGLARIDDRGAGGRSRSLAMVQDIPDQWAPDFQSRQQPLEHEIDEQVNTGNLRKLLQEAPAPNLVIVETPQELMDALESKARNIEIREHLDLTTVAPRNSLGVQIMLSDNSQSTADFGWSIRGNCTTEASASSLGVASEPEISSRPGQCVVVTDTLLMKVNENLWLHQLYILYHATDRSAGNSMLLYGGGSSSNLWMTDVSLQMNGDEDARYLKQGVVIAGGQLYAQGLVISDFVTDFASLVVSNGATANLQSCNITSNKSTNKSKNSGIISVNAVDPGNTNNQLQDTILKLQQCSITDNNADRVIVAGLTLAMFSEFDSLVFSDDASLPNTTGFVAASSQLSEVPASRPGISDASPWFVLVQQDAGVFVPRAANIPPITAPDMLGPTSAEGPAASAEAPAAEMNASNLSPLPASASTSPPSSSPLSGSPAFTESPSEALQSSAGLAITPAEGSADPALTSSDVEEENNNSSNNNNEKNSSSSGGGRIGPAAVAGGVAAACLVLLLAAAVLVLFRRRAAAIRAARDKESFEGAATPSVHTLTANQATGIPDSVSKWKQLPNQAANDPSSSTYETAFYLTPVAHQKLHAHSGPTWTSTPTSSTSAKGTTHSSNTSSNNPAVSLESKLAAQRPMGVAAHQPFHARQRVEGGLLNQQQGVSHEQQAVNLSLSRSAADFLPPPGTDATKDEKMEFIQQQLDSLGSEKPVMNGLVLLGNGVFERVQGGQAVVQMARSVHDGQDYAIKLFVTRKAFALEEGMYSGTSEAAELALFLPQVRNVEANDDQSLVDGHGHALPPCIVMERGESLDIWAARAKPDRSMAFAMIHHLAIRVRDLHALGYVHRDLKPGNVMWLPRKNRWTLIDFGCVARTGQVSRLCYSLAYAAPEVVAAFRRGEQTMVAQETVDVWALGVMVFELLTGERAISLPAVKKVVMDRIEGVNGEQLPWEGDRLSAVNKRRLGIFRASVCMLLARDPAHRPSMRQFCELCNRVLTGCSSVDE